MEQLIREINRILNFKCDRNKEILEQLDVTFNTLRYSNKCKHERNKKKKIISFAIRVWNFFKFFDEFVKRIQLMFYEIFIGSL